MSEDAALAYWNLAWIIVTLAYIACWPHRQYNGPTGDSYDWPL